MQSSRTARRAWILRAPANKAAKLGQDPHPQAQARRLREELAKIWTPAQRPERRAKEEIFNSWPEEVREWVRRVGRDAPEVYLIADSLRRAAQKVNGTAPGPDGWVAEAWLELPAQYWELLARLRQVVYDSQRIPRTWSDIRTVGIPKADGEGGLRPLSSEALAWRVDTFVVLHMIADWVVA